ncbi:hypothetical protein ACO0R3_000632 [Hanseniaspora guilliermondii]
MTTIRSGIELKDLGINDGIKNISNKTQKQVITKSNIPELIELIISTNKEYFNLKDNSIYLTNIIQIYKYKTKLLLDDVTGTILHLRNVFKGQMTSISTTSSLNDNSISIFKDKGLTIEGKDNITSKRIVSDINNIMSLNNGDINKYLSTRTTLKSQQKKNNFVGDVLDATSLFQYDDLDLVDEVEFGRSKKDKRTSLLNYERYDNNTQSSSNVSMSLDDIEFGRNESLLNKADVSLNSSMNEALALNDQNTDPFGFHEELDHDDILNDQGDDELDDGDYSLEQPRVMSEPEHGIEMDDMDLNINTPPQSPRAKGKRVQFGIPNNKFIKNYNLQVVVPDRSVEVPKRVYLQAMKKSINANDNQESINGRVNKRVLEQIYNFNDLQTLSLINLRQLKRSKVNQVNTSIIQSDDENAGDLSLQFDNIEQPEEVPEIDDDFNLMDHGSMNESINLEVQTENNSQSSYLTSTTPSMRLQREKDHIQQEMILAKTSDTKKEFKDLFETNKLNKAEVSQLFLQVLNLTTEDKIVVEQVGSNIYISK